MKQFAWREISLNIPDDWEPLAIGGHDKNGYVSLGAGLKIGLELKWNYSKFNVSVGKILNKFLHSIEKKAKQKKEIFKFSKDIDLKSKLLSFEWKTNNVVATGIIWHCDLCKRVVLCQLLNQDSNLTKEILSSLKCHDNEKRFWSIYNLSFSLPILWKLESYIFKSGYLKFVFVNGLKVIKIERWGLANNLLADISLEKWLSIFYKERFKENVSVSKINLQNHDGLKVIFTNKRKLFNLKKVIMLCFVWLCPESNRIFVVSESSNINNDEELLNIIKSIKCH
ncbi:MAG: hypothetical protein ABH873_00990 [Candidatus Firestonebacteria bacterium]